MSKETILKLETIYYKVKIYFKIDSNNCKIWWIFIFTLNMSWLYHFNYNLKSLIHVSSQNTFGQIFHSNQHKCVEKNHFWKIIFIWKYNKNYVWGLCIKIHFICLFVYRYPFMMKSNKNYPQNNTKNTLQKTFSCSRQPPSSVFSPLWRS